MNQEQTESEDITKLRELSLALQKHIQNIAHPNTDNPEFDRLINLAHSAVVNAAIFALRAMHLEPTNKI